MQIAGQQLLKHAAEAWRVSNKPGVVFHAAPRSSNHIWMGTFNHKHMVPAVALLGARQILRMNKMIQKNLTLDAPAKLLLESMQERDTVNAALAASSSSSSAPVTSG